MNKLKICKNFIYVAGLRVYIILGGGGACEGGDPLDTRQNFSQNFSSSSSTRNIKLEEGLHPQVYFLFLIDNDGFEEEKFEFRRSTTWEAYCRQVTMEIEL